MTRITFLVAIAALTGAFDGAALAQQATEIYIPIGQSPGLSGKYTVIGRIQDVDDEALSLTVRGADGRCWPKLDEHSRIYIDRSMQRLPNRYGSVESCGRGLVCEIKFRDNRHGSRTDPGVVEWIKIRADHGRSQADPPPRASPANNAVASLFGA